MSDLLDDEDGPPEPLYPLTQGRAAWDATVQVLDIVSRPAVERMLSEATPDEFGRITLHMNEWLLMQVAPAADDVLWDRLEDDQVL